MTIGVAGFARDESVSTQEEGVGAGMLRCSVRRVDRARCWSSRHRIVAVVFSSGLFAAVTVAGAQPPGSYQHVSDSAKIFIDRLIGNNNGHPDDAAAYNARPESERTTFEAIMHALEAEGVLDLVTGITAIWGEIPRSTQGLDQFRLSVTLAAGTPARLRASGFPGRKGPHVKLPDGRRVAPRDAATARQGGGVPSIQVSWLKRDAAAGGELVGEIDIDYISFGRLDFLGFGHSSPQNSDIRADRLGIPSNYDTHIRRYGLLERWW